MVSSAVYIVCHRTLLWFLPCVSICKSKILCVNLQGPQRLRKGQCIEAYRLKIGLYNRSFHGRNRVPKKQSHMTKGHNGLERRTGDRELSWVRIPLRQLRFGTLAILFTPLCQCLSEETLKAVGPFYLVSMPGKVKYSHRG